MMMNIGGKLFLKISNYRNQPKILSKKMNPTRTRPPNAIR